MAKSNSVGGRQIIIVGTVCFGVAGMLALVVLLFGTVSGTEFSPTHFESRQFTVREIPWLKIQISPIRRSASQSGTARYLIAQSLVRPAPGPPKDWHLVELTRGGMTQSQADAKLLTDQLDLSVYNHSQLSSNPYWQDWTINEPAKAKLLWPLIQKLATRELYILMPKLFAIALNASDDRSLQKSIDDYLRTSYFELVNEMRSVERDDLADELLAEAIADYPNDPKLQALR
jgi:hypothetical protein